MCISPSILLFDIYVAYRKARKHKASRHYVKHFERSLMSNLVQLRDELWNRTWLPGRSSCFVIERPKKREVFAAEFVDRIVHHLYYMYTYDAFVPTFIYDSYSCLEQRGTHFGIARMERHIRQASLNYTRPCYVLKLDISGYFMHIHRPTLLAEAKRLVDIRMDGSPYYDIVSFLTERIIMHNPVENCRLVSSSSSYEGLPSSKIMANAPEDCGMPIGNLTSQLFSNVYLNVFDQWMKRTMKCVHYGRYVDDAYIVSCDRSFLQCVLHSAASFLQERLHLNVHLGKSKIYNAYHGVEFLGAFLLPRRKYVSRESIDRMHAVPIYSRESMVSRLGAVSHYQSTWVKNSFVFGPK